MIYKKNHLFCKIVWFFCILIYDRCMLEKFLQEIGLSEKESTIYLHLLKVDSDSIANIAKTTNVNRTTVYPILDQLAQKGFVEEIVENEKSLYRAHAPDRIESFLQEQKIKIEEQVHIATDMIPQLKGIMREGGQRPIIEYYEGRDAIRKASLNYYDSDDEGGEVYLMYPRDEVETLFSDKERASAKELRLKKNVTAHAIYTYSKGDYSSNKTGNSYRVDSKDFPIKSDISVYADKIRIHNLGDKLGTVFIRNKDIADTLRSLFKLAFKGLEK